MKVKLLIDSEVEVLVSSHQGKLKKDGSSKPYKGQTGIACTIFSRERVRINYSKNHENSTDLKEKNRREVQGILKNVRKKLSENIDFDEIEIEARNGLELLSFNAIEEILKHPSFLRIYQANNCRSKSTLYNSLDSKLKAQLSLLTLIDKTDAIFGFRNLEWKIEQGFSGLQQALREHGQLIFQGKYGACFHGSENIKFYERDHATNRNVFYFKAGTVRTDTPWTHCVIVDQAKIIDGLPYVFFKDPYDPSRKGQPEKVYMLSYNSFVSRLSDKYGNPGTKDTQYGVYNEDSTIDAPQPC